VFRAPSRAWPEAPPKKEKPHAGSFAFAPYFVAQKLEQKFGGGDIRAAILIASSERFESILPVL
jgi:hypothetical protein